MKGSMRRNAENKHRVPRIATALGAFLMPLMAACGEINDSDRLAKESQSGGRAQSSSVLDACGEAPAGSIGAQIPSIGGEPTPGTFSCGPSDEFIADRRASHAQPQPITDQIPELSAPGIRAEGPSKEWVQGQVVQRNIVEFAEPGVASLGPSNQWIEEHK